MAKVFRRDWREWLVFLAFAGPNVLLFAIFTYYPLLRNFALAFQDYNIFTNEGEFIGLDNFKRFLTDPVTSKVFQNTLVFTASVVALILFLGLLAALLLNQKLKFRNPVRSLLFSPTVLAGSAVAVVWIYIFDHRSGLFYQILRPFGIAAPRWLLDPNWAMAALILVYVWKNLGYATVIYIAGLQAIPNELYEAARVDGANAWDRFRNVTIPGLSPVTFFLMVTSILNSFQAFDRLYELGFETNADYGKVAVMGVVLFVVMFIVTLFQLRYLERRVSYS
jgi:multiple sugar transport system permease protein/sn-glycerol 3-phosphate transport system permease protein